MVVGEIAEPVDLLVVGGGPGGYTAALRAAQLGREVVLVERGGDAAFGGSCLHVGCIPSKALIELADRRRAVEEWAPMGLHVGETSVDLGEFQGWKSALTSRLAGGVAGLLKQAKVRTITGDLRFNRRDRAVVRTPEGNAAFLEFRQAIVATGSRPVDVPILPVDDRRILNSTGALALEHVPETVAVLGGGYIGLELGTALAKLGSQVMIVEAEERLLPTVDVELLAPVERRLEELGVKVVTGTRATGHDTTSLLVDGPDGARALTAELIIVAVGRRPNTDELGLEAAGVQVDERGLIPVGPDMRANDRIAAIGDVVAGPALAHKAMREGGVAAEALSGTRAEMDVMTVPQVIFSDPEIALTGQTRVEAQRAGLDVDVATFPLAASGRAGTLAADRGLFQMVAEARTGRVLGVQIVAPHASDLIAEASLAVEMGAHVDDLADTIHAHPTLSEGIGEVAAMLAGRPIHAHGGTR